MSYFLLGGGVANFIDLADTPASYAGEAHNLASVNMAETALEFSAGFKPTNPVYTTDVIFGPAAGPAAWDALDIGVGPCIAFLKVVVAASAGRWVYFRQNGDAKNGRGKLVSASPNVGLTLSYVTVITDDTGLVEWVTNAAADNITITRLAYWPDPPMPNWNFSGAVGPVPYADLNLGVANALAILKVETTDVGGYFFFFRSKGETGPQWSASGVSIGNTTSLNSGYVIVKTNADGIVEFEGNAAMDYSITLLGFILGADFVEMVVYDGIVPAAYQDMDTPLGRGFVYMKMLHDVVAGLPLMEFRENGEALIINGDSGCSSNSAALTQIGYVFMLLDPYGTCEWISSGVPTAQVVLTVEAITR